MKHKITYLIREISITKRTILILLGCFIFSSFQAQNNVVTGKVTNNSGEGLEGATVTVQGTNTISLTNQNGEFSISSPTDGVLEVVYSGYGKKTVPINNQTVVNVILKIGVTEIDELVIIGYGSEKKSHLTGAISKVTNEDLDQIPAPRIDDALIGQVSGVNIQNTDGTVGAPPTIRIRGVGSVSASSSPLLVIDGTVVNYDFFGSIDMNDVQSFEVLKDAASASIYGSRGSNGVIIITTKQGKTGKTKVSYNGYSGFQDVQRNPDYNTSLADGAAAEMAANGKLSARTRYKQLIGVDNNWQDIIFDGGPINSHSLSVSGGNEAITFYTSLSLLDDKGVLLTDEFQKYNFKVRVDVKATDYLNFGVNLNPSLTNRRRFDGSTHDILRQTPWLPVYHDENTIKYVDRNTYPNVKVGDYAIQRHFDKYDLDGDGTLVSISNTSNVNPAAKVLERKYIDYKLKAFGKAYINLHYNGFSFNGAISGNIQSTRTTRWQGSKSHRNGASNSSSRLFDANTSHLVLEAFLHYNKTIQKHDINATLGFVSERRIEKYADFIASGYEFDNIETINAATTMSNFSSYTREKNLVSYIGRLNYAYADKYLASFSLRTDGSSVFGENTKYGLFPAASIGWVISKENFLSNLSFINMFKVRASYGVTGNDNITTGNSLIDWYASQALLNTGSAIVNNAVVTAYSPSNVANENLGWEKSIEYNPGVDFGFFGNIITGSFDYYHRTSTDLILNIAVSSVSGFNEALVNRGEVTNEGYEFEVRTRNITIPNFSWSTTLIGSQNKNTLTNFGESNGLIQSVDAKRAAEWINQVGRPISSFYGYVFDKNIPLEYLKDPYHPVGGQAQDVYVKDLNGDGVIDDDDKTILGDPYPDFIWSITNEFTIYDFDLSFMIQGSQGAKVRNMADQYLYNHFNSSQDYNTATTPNQGFIKEKIFTNAIIQDASYISLRNVTIGYKLPKILRHITGRVYVSAQNLLYLKSSDFTGFNPEAIRTTSPTTYGYSLGGGPIARRFVFGVRLEL